MARLCARLPLCVALLLAFSVTLAAEHASALPPGDNLSSARERAAAAYDRGVTAFDRHDYARAARSFLDADAIVPNDDAIANAVSAARLSRDPALLAEATARAERSRPSTPGDPRTPAAAASRRAEDPPKPDDPASDPASDTAPAAASTQSSPAPNSSTPRTPPTKTTDRTGSPTKTWSPAVFYVGAGTTAALLGVTVWSGIDALNARARLPGTKDENDDVHARAHRTDALLAATVVVGAATAFVGFRLVNWQQHAEVAASVTPAAQTLVVRGAF